MENYLDTLNPSQRAAVEYCDGPQLVIAGAGSGKTRVLTCKIAYLLQHDYLPDSIIALTFTKKAATEMQTRIQQLIGGNGARRIWMGTFHSLFSRILRREAQRIGFTSDFTIYDQTDSTNLISTIIKDMGLKSEQYKASSIHCQISNAKNYLITPKMYLANKELLSYDSAAGRPLIGEIYQRYWTRCSQANAMDFDDLLLYTNILFRDHKDVLEYYQDYFKYVLVDEYQDTNHAQHAIIIKLTEKHKHLTVVGDDAQSIYSFRGADINNILNLPNQIKGTKIFKLEQNYRSTKNIVEAANSLIYKNKEQIRKTVFSENERGYKIKLTRFRDGKKEAFHVIQQIINLHDSEHQKYKDCAILYRANSLSTEFERVLNSAGIKYRIFGGQSFFDSKEVKDMMAMLRIMSNTNDEEAFKRVIKVCPFGIGESTIRKISDVIQEQSISIYEILWKIDNYLPTNKGIKTKLEIFYQAVTDCLHFSRLNSVYDTMKMLLQKFHYNDELAKLPETDRMLKIEKENQFLYIIKDEIDNFKKANDKELSITDFLSHISLSETEPENEDSDSDYVSLMTIHQAKGLEFKNVFVVGVENEIFPSQKSIHSAKDIEEERRLFYVAITRAESNCYISYADERFRFGKNDPCQPSIFLKDIDPQYIQKDNSYCYSTNYASNGGGTFDSYATRGTFSNGSYANPFEPRRPMQNAAPRPVAQGPTRSPLDLNRPRKVATHTTPIASVTSLTYGGQLLTSGSRIAHERFGRGTITELEGHDDDARVKVHFDTVGDKTLLLKFAKFTLLPSDNG